MRENQLARDIVANLARRYRSARRFARAGADTSEAQLMRDAKEIEIWNAYMTSRLILFREEGANVL